MTGKKPEALNICGIPHEVKYCDKAADVDTSGRGIPLVGQIDHWKRVIKIYDNGRPAEDIWEVLMHEVLHGIGEAMHLKFLEDCGDDNLDLLALALNDFLFRNNIISFQE